MPGAADRVLLTVAEAPRSDVGLGRARLDSNARSALKVDTGEIVQIVGKRSTSATVFRAGRKDLGKGIIRLDGLVRRNVGASLGDKIEVRKADVLPAERVTIAPIISEGHKISFGQGIENFVKRRLIGRVVNQDDVVVVPGVALLGGALPFVVTRTEPGGVVRIQEGTVIEMREEPIRETDSPLKWDLSDLLNLQSRLMKSEGVEEISLSSPISSADDSSAQKRAPTGKRCGLCGKTVTDREAESNHMNDHIVPVEAQPPAICRHPPLCLKVWWDGEVTLGDLPARLYRKNYDSLPPEFRQIIEDEYGAGRSDIGWFFPKTRKSAYFLDVIYHMKWNAESL